MSYKITKKVEIGQYSEQVTSNINQSLSSLEKHTPLVLTTSQRLNLDISLKTPNRVVFDSTENRWYKWSLFGGTYTWRPISFADSIYAGTVSSVHGMYVLPDNTTQVSVGNVIPDRSGKPINTASETLIVTLDGTVLSEGVNYTYDAVGNKVTTTGVWYKGQEMGMIILFSDHGDIDTDLSGILSRLVALESETGYLSDAVDAQEQEIDKKLDKQKTETQEVVSRVDFKNGIGSGTNSPLEVHGDLMAGDYFGDGYYVGDERLEEKRLMPKEYIDSEIANAVSNYVPILNLENIGFFEKYGNLVEITTEDFILNKLDYRLLSVSELGLRTPIPIGIRNRYGLDKYLILTDSPIQDFEGIVEFYDRVDQTNAKITIWERQAKAVERQNVKQYVKFFRNDITTDWESIAYESDIEKVEQELLNEISEVDAKSTENKNTIDDIISGRQTVGKALTAVNLTSQERQSIEDVFSTRITAKYENEIISSIDEETTAEIVEIGGFSVKQLVKDGETTVELAQNNVYLAKASGTNITLSSGTQTINLTNGIAKFAASESETYTFNGTDLANCKVYSLTEMGIDSLSLEQANQLLGNKSYPYGITNTKPSKLISVGENLFDWREFYDALKAVDPDNVEIVNKDGRECIKITNPVNYFNKGIKLWQGKFAPNVRYRFSSYHLNEEGTIWYGAGINATYTNGIPDVIAGNAYHSSWKQIVKDTVANHTVDYISLVYGSTANSLITYFDINTMQLQMLDNPETNFIPYTEKEVELPSAYADYGMPSLPNGVRDRIFRVGNSPDNSKWYYEKNVGKIVFDGSENWGYENQPKSDEIVFKYSGFNFGRELSSLNGNIFGSGINYERIVVGYTIIYIRVYVIDIPNYQDSWTTAEKANAFKDWLQANPITVYYQLNEPQLTRIDDWNSQYLAYNYGREEIVDSEGNTTPTYTVIKYYLDYVKQTQTSNEIMAIQQTTIQSLQSQLESIESRVIALENK